MVVEHEETLEQIASEEEDEQAAVPIYKIVSYPADPTLEVLHQRWQRKEIIIPKFQRGWVWSHSQASKLIDSFLRGLPVPSIFVYKEPSTQHQLVIDGQQRLRTISGFFDGTLPSGRRFYLRDVSPEWEGKFYDSLAESDRIRLRDSVLRAITIEQLDPRDDSSIFHIFERLNTGGTGLNPQEVRNSIAHGPFNDAIIELNGNMTWRSVFGTGQVDNRMRDVELIVRFLALFEDEMAYTKPMKKFLNSFMLKHKADTEAGPYLDSFVRTVERVSEAFGPSSLSEKHR